MNDLTEEPELSQPILECDEYQGLCGSQKYILGWGIPGSSTFKSTTYIDGRLNSSSDAT